MGSLKRHFICSEARERVANFHENGRVGASG